MNNYHAIFELTQVMVKWDDHPKPLSKYSQSHSQMTQKAYMMNSSIEAPITVPTIWEVEKSPKSIGDIMTD